MKRDLQQPAKRWLARVCAVVLPGVLTQCETPDVVATAGETQTPEHNFSKHEYPFDSSGKYREDWVETPSGVDSGGTPSTAAAGEGEARSQPESRFRTKTASASRTSPPVKMTEIASVSRSTLRFHTIGRGDTLWGLSRRYGVSVGAIKRANSLSSDAVRMGQTLRIP